MQLTRDDLIDGLREHRAGSGVGSRLAQRQAVMFIPTWGQPVDWQPVLDDEKVSIAIAPPPR
jgi:hypothetical protein